MRYEGIEVIPINSKENKSTDIVERINPDFILISHPFAAIDAGFIITNIRKISEVPIIILANTKTGGEKARLLEIGADEYLCKPIDYLEFLSTVNAVIRRNYRCRSGSKSTVNIDDRLTLNFDTHELRCLDKPIHLTPLEYNLLSTLVKHNGMILSYQTILEKVWGVNYVSDVALLKKYIYYLRSKLELNPHDPKLILTERSFGYHINKATQITEDPAKHIYS